MIDRGREREKERDEERVRERERVRLRVSDRHTKRKKDGWATARKEIRTHIGIMIHA